MMLNIKARIKIIIYTSSVGGALFITPVQMVHGLFIQHRQLFGSILDTNALMLHTQQPYPYLNCR